MGIRAAAATNKGQTERINQDAIYAKTWILENQEIGVIAIADGMGGHEKGEMASAIVMETLERWCTTMFRQEVSLDSIAQSLESVFMEAHNQIDGKAGATLTVCLVCSGNYIIKNTGDTRCYLLSGKQLQQLSVDDSWVAEQVAKGEMDIQTAKAHPKQHLLTKCVGMGKSSVPHEAKGRLPEGEILFICSDGFYKKLSDEEMMETAKAWQRENSNPLEWALPVLFERGERDNISIALIC